MDVVSSDTAMPNLKSQLLLRWLNITICGFEKFTKLLLEFYRKVVHLKKKT